MHDQTDEAIEAFSELAKRHGVSMRFLEELVHVREKHRTRNIGWAVEQLVQNRKRVRRAGWNGRGMFLAYQRGYTNGIEINQNTADAIGEPVGAFHRFLPYVIMRTVDGAFVPWLCSQTDLLATDWELAE